MKACLSLVLILAGNALLAAQERPVPKDSARITVAGCTRGQSLIVTRRTEAEPVSGSVEPGRRFRLSGQKKVLAEIRARKGQVVEVTGLVRLAQLSGSPSGMPIGGSGRIRIGGGPPNSDPTRVDVRRDPLFNEAVMDVESWRQLAETCEGS